jgi:phosphoglycerol transferase MdoB-like AlkP superfamily enzyme
MSASRHPVSLLRLINNLLLVYLLYMLCRVVYVGEFWDLYAEGWERLSMWSLLKGGLRFDTSAILYTNTLYVLLALLPLPRRFTARKAWRNALKTLFVAVNALMLVINLVDTVYSRYTGRRTTWTFFSEFSNEGNLAGIVGVELINHWYLVLVGIAFIAALILLYRHPYRPASSRPLRSWQYVTLSVLCILIYAPLAIIGMRGGASTAIRPITISNANQYVNRPSEAAIVLNTPFSLIRTMGKTTFTDPQYLPDDRLDAVYSPLHLPGIENGMNMELPVPAYGHPSKEGKAGTVNNSRDLRFNVVVIILESFGQEYIGAYNDYPGYTPFLDSLIGHSLTFRHSYANGRKSIDGMPSILSGIPMFVEPFFVTGYSLNNVSGIASELSRQGYTTAFFHGAENGSMGFQAFARTTGFQHYYGRTEYEADSRFGGDNDFDGTWAIWDEEFMQYYAAVMQELPQPFMTALFTATSHHPFAVPARYADSLRADGHPLHTCIRYTDHALRRFFAAASRMPWYSNTLFVITADHTNINQQHAYSTLLGTFSVPVIFYSPSGQLPTGMSRAVAQQTDIMPTVLGLTGCSRPYVAYGVDLLHTPDSLTWAIHYNNGIYQYVQDSCLLLFDGQHPVGFYNIESDPMLQNNLLTTDDRRIGRYTERTMAIIQSYMQRMVNNRLTP